MNSISNLLKACLVLFLLCWVVNIVSADGIFDVTQYGAVGDGKHDSTSALLNAWKDACAATGRPQITIPQGDFWVGPLLFKGPCNGSVTIQLDGNLLADTNLQRYESSSWLDFQYINGLTIKGRGKLDGQGTTSWPHNQCPKNWNCKLLPITMSLSFVNNVSIRGIYSINPKFFHFDIFSSKNIEIKWITIQAPRDSPNTDGIHMGLSSNITITDSNIGTGDDCVSIGSNTTDVTVTGITCGPGHGISVGSLGKGADKGDVIGLLVKNCTIFNTMNGVRIKTWQSKPNMGKDIALKVSNFTFDDIVMKNVSNPIIIDQEYCPYHNCPESEPSRVKITGIKFNNIRGTSITEEVINMVCSSLHPCEELELNNIKLEYVGRNSTAVPKATCLNVNGVANDVNELDCV